MSSDHLLHTLQQCANSLPALRSLPLLFAATARQEAPAGEGGRDLIAALTHFIVRGRQPVECAAQPRVTYFNNAVPACRAVYVLAGAPRAEAAAAYREFGLLAERLESMCCQLPPRLAGRVGLDAMSAQPDWENLLFHFAWHFPHHFISGPVRRSRLLLARGGRGEFEIDESGLQAEGSELTEDYFPGVIFLAFPRTADLAAATGWAIDLLARAVRGGGGSLSPDDTRRQFGDLAGCFVAARELAAGAGGRLDLSAAVFSHGTSFGLPAGAAVAGYPLPGPRTVYVLSARGAAKEFCVLAGPRVEAFVELADRAGALLPDWPAVPYPTLFGPADRATAALDGYVTDHRGNVERWIGFVFATLKERAPDGLEVRAVPAAGGGGISFLDLRGLDLFSASARAIELAGLTDPQSGGREPVGPPPPVTPVWDRTARRLTYRGEECKAYRRGAREQEKILAAFEEEGWPEAIDDPLPKGKLAKTVESLNQRLQHIRFTRNGAGTGVLWAEVRSRADDG